MRNPRKRLRRRASPRPKALFIVARVGQVAHLPRRYRTTSCTECGAACWISGDLVDATEGRGMAVEPICFACCSEPVAGGKP